MTALVVRRAAPEDLAAVLGLMRTALGWRDGDPNAELFAWKHEQSPFGPSPAWVALDGPNLVGFRTFMRWEFERQGALVRAVRAVDTATHPDHQGRGIFKRLTLLALDELQAEGVDLVFNTPNDQSRPGYLKMGWEPVGGLPVAVRLSGLGGLLRTARARQPAELWSEPVRGGRGASDVLHSPAIEPLLAADSASRLVTRRSKDYLLWRYGLPQLHYRVTTGRDDLSGGAIVWRARRRGAALECAVVEVLTPGIDASARRRLLASALSESGADYAIAVGRPAGMLPVPGQGPLLVMRALAGRRSVELDGWQLSLGDVELF